MELMLEGANEQKQQEEEEVGRRDKDKVKREQEENKLSQNPKVAYIHQWDACAILELFVLILKMSGMS